MIQGTLCLDKPLKIKLIPSLLVGFFWGGWGGFCFSFLFCLGGFVCFSFKVPGKSVSFNQNKI